MINPIVSFRRRFCLTQLQLSAMLNISRVSLYRWEMGEVRPSRRYFRRLRKLMLKTLWEAKDKR
jgi:DNA-binding transcriptional regulator YiaG